MRRSAKAWAQKWANTEFRKKSGQVYGAALISYFHVFTVGKAGRAKCGSWGKGGRKRSRDCREVLVVPCTKFSIFLEFEVWPLIGLVSKRP